MLIVEKSRISLTRKKYAVGHIARSDAIYYRLCSGEIRHIEMVKAMYKNQKYN